MISVGGATELPTSGAIEHRGDRDRFTVELQAGRIYIIEVRSDNGGPTAAGPLSDPYLQGVYSSETGRHISNTENDDFKFSTRNSLIEFRPNSSNTFHIVARANGGRVGAYTVLVTDGELADAEGSTPATAATIAVGGSRDARVDHHGDVDWFAVDMAAGRTYNFRLEARPPNPLTWRNKLHAQVLGVYGADGAQIEGDGFYKAEEYSPVTSGTYYFAVRGMQYTSDTPEIGTYRTFVEDVTNSNNDPGDALHDALELPINGSRLGSIDRSGDRDRFRVELQAGRIYVIEQRGRLYERGPDLELLNPNIRGVYDADGVRIPGTGNDDMDDYTLNSRVQFTPQEDGAYYVSVSHGGRWRHWAHLGTYQIAIQDVTDVDDYGADTETAGSLRIGQWKRGEVEKAHDQDWFAVDLTGGIVYRILVQGRCAVPWQGSCLDRGTLTLPALYGIHDAEGNMLPDSSAYSKTGWVEVALKSLVAPSDGRYHVNVGGSGRTGTYRVKIENLSARDQTEDVNTNGHIVVGGYVQGEVDFSGDKDWFAVDLQAGHAYEFDLRGGEGGHDGSQGNLSYPQLHGIYDSDGELIPDTGGSMGEDDGPSTVVFTPETGGRFYVSAGAFEDWAFGSGGGVGTYTLYVSDRDGPDDHRSDIQTEGRVQVCGSVQGRIERDRDQDWFAVDLEAGVTYQIDLEHGEAPAGLFDPYLRGIYDAVGTLIEGTTNDHYRAINTHTFGVWDDLNSRVMFTPEESGRYYIAAGHGYQQQNLGIYTLSVTRTDGCDFTSGGPDFGAATASRSMPENSPAGTAVGEPVTATDPDAGALTYSLEGIDAASFAIDSATGQLSTVAGVIYDYETKSGYEVTVRAENGEGLSDAIAVTITLTDVPEPGDNTPATGLPTIVGTVRVGERLTADVSGIADADGLTNAVFSYQWLSSRDTEIEVGTAPTYTLQEADLGKIIKVTVSFADDAGNAETLTSAATDAVADRPNVPATGLPTISGAAQVGETLTADVSGIADADGLDNVSYRYQWVANDGASDADISGATGSTYNLTFAEAEKTIKVRVSFTDDRGQAESLTSAATEAVSATSRQQANTPATGQPTISGTAQVGETLTVDTSGISDDDGLTHAVFSYQWHGDGSDIAGATNAAYTLTDADEGKAISVTVSFTDDAGNAESLTSAATGAVAARPNSQATGLPTISGTAQVGETLTADVSGIADADGLDNVAFSYQWQADGADIAGATVSTYTLVEADEGKAVSVTVSFTDDRGHAESLTSAATTAVAARPNTSATGLPTITGTVQVGETMTADVSGISDEDGLDAVSFAYQWQADGADIVGATGSSHVLTDTEEGKAISVAVSFTDDAGNTESLTSAATAAVAGPPPEPLTASFSNGPSSHDGESVFTFELHFSEEFSVSYKRLRDQAFIASGGDVTRAKRLERGSNVGWRIHVRPDGDGAVTIILPETTDCDDDGAICTGDGRMLSNRSELTVGGP